jgi:hypothetical protein
MFPLPSDWDPSFKNQCPFTKFVPTEKAHCTARDELCHLSYTADSASWSLFVDIFYNHGSVIRNKSLTWQLYSWIWEFACSWQHTGCVVFRFVNSVHHLFPRVALGNMLCYKSASELYRLSDRRLSVKLVPTFADRWVSHGQCCGSPTAVISIF